MTDNIRRFLADPSMTPHEHREGFDVRFPLVIAFEGLGFCFYALKGFRAVEPGEYYLVTPDPADPELVEGIRAPHRSPIDSWVARPTFRARCKLVQWEIGEPIAELPPMPLDTPPDSER